MSKEKELACALHFQLEGVIRLLSALGGCLLVTRNSGEVDTSFRTLLGPDGSTGALNADDRGIQFRCVALSGKTNHPAFTHQTMISGVIETGVALNIALPGQPFLMIPIRGLGCSKKWGVVGVLCVAWKVDNQVQQFSANDEAVATTAAMMIATLLARCPASRFVDPYPVQRLANLGLQTLLVPETESTTQPRFLDRPSAPLVYRSSSRSVLSGMHVGKLEPEAISSLVELHDLVNMNELTQSMLEKEQALSHELGNLNVQLERKIRSLQQELRNLSTTLSQFQSDEAGLRLSAHLSQVALEERIVMQEFSRRGQRSTAVPSHTTPKIPSSPRQPNKRPML